jgi:phosphoglycolate phosphatase
VPGLDDSQIPALAERYRHHYLGRDHELVLFDGVREMLVELKERGYQLAVATGKTRAGLNRALASCGVGHLFDATRCADESLSKPHPAMLLELMHQRGVKAGVTIMIGDTTHDLLMAVNAGTHGLGVGYGAHPVDELRSVASRGVVSSVEQVRNWLLTNA